MSRLIILLLSLLTLSCGWHLRGAISLPSSIEKLHLSAEDSYSPVLVELRRRLEDADITLVERSSEAPYSLTILEQSQDSRVAGVGSNALAAAYELTLQARYEIRRSSGEVLAPNLSSNVVRSYSASAVTAGADSQEQSLVLKEMRRELAQQILRQLQAQINAAEAQAPATTTESESNGQAAP